jgi:DNA-binding transcriptional LysR family regulator
VSAQIKALEDELGVALFERVSSGMVLTTAGRRLLPEALKVVAAAQSLRSRARAIQGQVIGRARVGTVSDPEVRARRRLSRARARRASAARNRNHHEVTGEAFAKVRDGTLDASFYYGDLEHADVTAVPLIDFAFRVAAPAAWADRIKHASWDELVAMPWIMSPPISTLRTLAEGLFNERGSSPVMRTEANNEAVIRSLVVAGSGVGLMREDVALEAAAAGEVALWSNVRLETTLQFLYLKQREHDPEIWALLDVLHHVWISAPAAIRETV